MKLFTETEYKKLLENGRPENQGKDHHPVAKLFITGTGGTLVLTEIRSEKPLLAYGLCDLNSEFCQLTQIDFDRISNLATRNGSELKRSENLKRNRRSATTLRQQSAAGLCRIFSLL